MFSHRVEEWARRIARRVGQFVAKSGLTPNAVTIIGFLLNFPVALILAQGQTWSWIVGGLGIIFAGVFDMLDGGIARATGKTTKFGAFLDSNVDRLSEIVVLGGISLYFYLNRSADQYGGSVLVYVAMCSSMMVSYSKARAEGLQMECKGVGLLQRPERVILTAIGCFAQAFWDMSIIVVLWLIALGTIYTTIQRIGHIWLETSRQEKADRLAELAASKTEPAIAQVAEPAKNGVAVAAKTEQLPEEEPRKLWSFRRAGR